MFERGADVLVIGDVVLAFDRKRGNLELVYQRRGDIILSRKRVGSGEDDVRAALLQRDHQVGGLGGHMQTRRNAQPFERLLLLEALADLAQDGHFALRPIHAAASAFRLVDVLDIVITHVMLLRFS